MADREKSPDKLVPFFMHHAVLLTSCLFRERATKDKDELNHFFGVFIIKEQKRGERVGLTIDDFQLFDRACYTFKQLKEQLTEAEIEKIKIEYKKHWQKWKAMQREIAGLLPEAYQMSKPKIESWTNGWNLRSHFWCAYRSVNRQTENACLAVLLNKKQFQVYLMFQHYKSDERTGSIADYNELLSALQKWSDTVAIEDYYIWPQLEDELADHLPLSVFLQSEENQRAFREAMGDRTFQLGKLLVKAERIVDSVQVTG
ncbi:hypothetical protein A5888_003094 [Enterococcus sp. 9E7_DIV0242]|uniref:Uncharacterized protein n=1 Tax=Candidatus Enterococcus clewellii TaxID=1834193 RepID=A0A242K973_9ENTE|nr:glucose-6-phosphate 1-dehydrogenase family protein [Enterococcus sp. 9E7_DIV0242]OTP17713.1 hypothetical protein A5888_001851 [Enterococcus sp. 9E7_DIV0242]